MKPIEKQELKKWIKQEQENNLAFYSKNIIKYWGNFVLSRVESGEVTTLKQAKFLGLALWVFYDNAIYIKDHEAWEGIKMDSKRKAFFNRIFGKNFWDFRKNQYYFYYLDGSKVYFENNVWYWDNRQRYWFKYLDSGKRIITRDDSGKILHRL